MGDVATGRVIKVFTEEEKRPYTTDIIAKKAIDNIFCNGDVAKHESAPGFIGWTVFWLRPLAKNTTRGMEESLCYGDGGTVFSNYSKAVLACVTTYEFAKRKGYTWFEDIGKMRIFSLVRE